MLLFLVFSFLLTTSAQAGWFMRNFLIVLLASFISTTTAVAQTAEQKLEWHRFNVFTDDLGRHEKLLKSIVTTKKSECLTKFADESLCACLVEKLPVVVSMNNYLSMSMLPEDNAILELQPEGVHRLLLSMREAKYSCVGK